MASTKPQTAVLNDEIAPPFSLHPVSDTMLHHNSVSEFEPSPCIFMASDIGGIDTLLGGPVDLRAGEGKESALQKVHDLRVLVLDGVGCFDRMRIQGCH